MRCSIRLLNRPPQNPDHAARRARVMSLIDEHRIPSRVYRLPAGTIARMAINHWSRRSPSTVVAASVAHGGVYHQQQHRARADMGVGELRR